MSEVIWSHVNRENGQIDLFLLNNMEILWTEAWKVSSWKEKVKKQSKYIEMNRSSKNNKIS